MRTILSTMLLLGFALPLLAQESAQECDTSRHPLSAPAERFIDNGDGTVTDKNTSSVWMRCSLGQEWEGKTCTGEATLYTWEEMETLADEFNLDGYAGHDDWRLPNLPEIGSITEGRCINPRINTEIFPLTPSVAYWSNMTRPSTNLVYVMHFGEGGVDAYEKTYRGPIRLLRGERWWVPPSVREMRKQEQDNDFK